MLNRTEVEIFKLTSEPKNISQIKEELKLDHSTISLAVKSLIDNGFVVKIRKGKNVVVQQSESPHSSELSTLIREYPRLPWSKLLDESSLHVMSVLKNTSRNIKDTANITGLHRHTVSSVINRLSIYGIILKGGNGYYLNRKHRIVIFVDYYWYYINNKKLRNIAKKGIIIWERGSEFLFKTDDLSDINADEMVQPTALTVFPKYGLNIISEIGYYFYSMRKLQVEDYIIHTILIEPENAIYNSYALALYLKSNATKLLEYSSYYDMQDHVNTLLKFLDKKEKVDRYTLPWNEHEEIVNSLV